MKRVIISPYSKPMRNGKENPKNYPYWKDVISALKGKGLYVIQIGKAGERELGADEYIFNAPLSKLEDLVASCDTWIGVDNFFQHLCYVNGKRGVVIFGKSDPNVFGHQENINILKDRKYLRKNQFLFWELDVFDAEVFESPQVVVNAVESILGETQ